MSRSTGLSAASLATDIHCHLLPGVDDGSRTLAESVVMARSLADMGVKRLSVTPHQFRFGLDWTPAQVAARVSEVRAELERHGISIELVPAAEHLFGERLLTAIERQVGLITWGASGETRRPNILVELPLRDPVVGVETVARLLVRHGLRPVMAHPERVESVIEDPSRLDPWQAAGWEFQLDLLALSGSYGRKAEQTAELLLDEGRYSWLGSDLHRSSQVPALERAHARLRARLGDARGASASALPSGTPLGDVLRAPQGGAAS
jgi:tyrosine-protein phosphatase YwqE